MSGARPLNIVWIRRSPKSSTETQDLVRKKQSLLDLLLTTTMPTGNMVMVCMMVLRAYLNVAVTGASALPHKRNAHHVTLMHYSRFPTESLMFPGAIAANTATMEQGWRHDRKLADGEDGCRVIESSSIFGNFFGPSCSCGQATSDAPFVADCPNFCKTCNNDLGICVSSSWTVTYNMSSSTTGSTSSTDKSNNNETSPRYLHQIGSLQYSGKRNDLLTYQAIMDVDSRTTLSCSVAINGVNCNECRASTAFQTNCSSQRFYNCSNIESGLVVDQCLGDENRLPSTSPMMALNTNYFNYISCFIPPDQVPPQSEDNGSAGSSGSSLIWGVGWGKYAFPFFLAISIS